MSNEILKFIKQNLNKSGRLACKKAFEIAAKFNISKEELGQICENNQIRIDDCILGVFGKLEYGRNDAKILEKLKANLDEKNRIHCKDCLSLNENEANLRSTLRKNNIEVIYCELGCFKEKKGKKLVLKTKTWVENTQGDLLFGQGKNELLDLILQKGSLLNAAKAMGINYKKAWTHLQNLQKNSQESLVITRQGRSKDSGTKLTPRALELMQKYQQLNEEVQEFANKRFKEIFFKKD